MSLRLTLVRLFFASLCACSMVLKSDGSGLYATKDLALAKRKFDEFQIDQSIYIVDAAQTLHFKQVFKTLELMGYEKAKQCVHIPYGQVVLPSGKMSSRTGTVIMFSQLRALLAKDIYDNFLGKYDANRIVDKEAEAKAEAEAAAAAAAAAAEGKQLFVKQAKNITPWSPEELAQAAQTIAVATIKYGMLNHDVAKVRHTLRQVGDVCSSLSQFPVTVVLFLSARCVTASLRILCSFSTSGRPSPATRVCTCCTRTLVFAASSAKSRWIPPRRLTSACCPTRASAPF